MSILHKYYKLTSNKISLNSESYENVKVPCVKRHRHDKSKCKNMLIIIIRFNATENVFTTVHTTRSINSCQTNIRYIRFSLLSKYSFSTTHHTNGSLLRNSRSVYTISRRGIHSMTMKTFPSTFHRLCHTPLTFSPKRFFPGPLPILLPEITSSTARRILNIFHQKHNLTPFWKNRLPDRKSYFQFLRELSEGKSNIILTAAQLRIPNISQNLSIAGRYAGTLHLNKMYSDPLLLIPTSAINTANAKEKESLSGNREQKLALCLQKRDLMLKNMDIFCKEFKSNGIIQENILIQWFDYLDTRSPILKLTHEEKNIQQYLQEIFAKNNISKENFIAIDKDPLSNFKTTFQIF